MKSLKQNANNILLCLFEILVGFLLLINPVGFTSGIIIAAGIILLAVGLGSIVKYFKTDPQKAALSQTLAKGLTALLAGGFCVFNSQWFVTTFPMLTILYGVILLLAGLLKVQMSVDMIRLKNRKWFLAAVSAVLSIVCAAVIIRNPFASAAVLWIFTGITLIAESVLDIITLILNGKEKNEEAAA